MINRKHMHHTRSDLQQEIISMDSKILVVSGAFFFLLKNMTPFFVDTLVLELSGDVHT